MHLDHVLGMVDTGHIPIPKLYLVKFVVNDNKLMAQLIQICSNMLMASKTVFLISSLSMFYLEGRLKMHLIMVNGSQLNWQK